MTGINTGKTILSDSHKSALSWQIKRPTRIFTRSYPSLIQNRTANFLRGIRDNFPAISIRIPVPLPAVLSLTRPGDRRFVSRNCKRVDFRLRLSRFKPQISSTLDSERRTENSGQSMSFLWHWWINARMKTLGQIGVEFNMLCPLRTSPPRDSCPTEGNYWLNHRIRIGMAWLQRA